MPMIQKIAVDYAMSGAQGDPLRTNVTPFSGNLIATIPAVPSGAALALEGSEDQVTWTPLLTLAATEGGTFEVGDLKRYLRANVTATGTGTAEIVLEGVQ